MQDCLFCKIANREIDTTMVYEDDQCIAFRDIAPAAPIHILVVPKIHMDSLNEATDEQLTGHLMHVVAKVAQNEGLKNGYRVVINSGEEGGQTVGHLHIHLLGGRSMTWPPG